MQGVLVQRDVSYGFSAVEVCEVCREAVCGYPNQSDERAGVDYGVVAAAWRMDTTGEVVRRVGHGRCLPTQSQLATRTEVPGT